jgi:hypothetical protein
LDCDDEGDDDDDDDDVDEEEEEEEEEERLAQEDDGCDGAGGGGGGLYPRSWCSRMYSMMGSGNRYLMLRPRSRHCLSRYTSSSIGDAETVRTDGGESGQARRSKQFVPAAYLTLVELTSL